MSAMLNFFNRVVVVTGAGSGLGRQYALSFAQRGAKVVVNDLGGTMHGSSASNRPADTVVAEIKSAGGEAVANYDSVCDNGEGIINTAIQHFGRIDVLVNNAGILRDKSFAKMTDQDWSLIHAVHVLGAYKTTKAAWPHMRKQRYGRLIFTSSVAGLYGNFGQTNYSSAKSALLGLSSSLSKEGASAGILSNVVCPNAGTRLTETVLPPDVVELLKPEFCVPVVLYLTHESCEQTGRIFETGGGWTSQVRFQRSKAFVVKSEKDLTSPEAVRDNFNDVTDFSDADAVSYPDDPIAAFSHIVEQLKSVTGANKRELTGWRDAIGLDLSPVTYRYSDRDACLYALAVGAPASHLHRVYECDSSFTILPGFTTLGPLEGLFTQLPVIPGIDMDLSRLLHGEQYTELFAPIPKSDDGAPISLTNNMKIVALLDNGRHARVVVNAESFHGSELIALNQFVIVYKGSGNFGGSAASDAVKPLPRSLQSFKEYGCIEYQTAENQAALYRLTGDNNPLHIDPDFAGAMGFPLPILHGLCTLGISVRELLDTAKFGSPIGPHAFKSVKCRFVAPVIPGDLLKIAYAKSRSVGATREIDFKVSKRGKAGSDIVVVEGCLITSADVVNGTMSKL